MAHINLLPWREEQRALRQREFLFTLVGGAMVAVLLVAFGHLRLNGIISAQENRNDFLHGAIAELDDRIEKIKDLESTRNQLLARMNIIQELQRNRPLSVHLADELVRTLPDGVYLSEITQQGESLTMSGYAQSNARVSAYMRNIDTSDWLNDPKLDVIKTNDEDGRRIAEFTLRADQKGAVTDTDQTLLQGETDATSGT